MNVVILCAGFATRMYPLTKNFPKPLLEVGGKRVLDYFIEQINRLPEVETVHIVSNDKFYDHFENWRRQNERSGIFGNYSVTVHNNGTVDNETRMGAAGDLFLALEKIGTPGKVLVSGGDNIYQFSIKSMCEKFLTGTTHSISALFETDIGKLQKTGVLELAEDGRVVKLHEKPSQPPSSWICPPLYFFQPSVWPILECFLTEPGNHDAPGYFIDYLCRQETVMALKLNGSRLDIGSIGSFQQADMTLHQEPLDLEQM